MSTKNNPGKYDCFTKAKPDEPMFILLGRDPCAGLIIRFWAAIRVALKGPVDEDMLKEALACADEMDEWAKKLGKEGEVKRVIAACINAAQQLDVRLQSTEPEPESNARDEVTKP